MRDIATKCHIHGKPCGHNGIYCAACPDNPKLLFELPKEHYPGWQICPVCNGFGEIEDRLIPLKYHPCEVCKGKRIINLKTGLPPDNENRNR